MYQHTVSALALPTKLVLPTGDIAEDYRPAASTQQEAKKVSVRDLLEKGAGNRAHDESNSGGTFSTFSL